MIRFCDAVWRELEPLFFYVSKQLSVVIFASKKFGCVLIMKLQWVMGVIIGKRCGFLMGTGKVEKYQKNYM